MINTITRLNNCTPIQHKLFNLLLGNGEMNRDQICEEFGFDKVKNPKYDQYKMRTTIYDNLLKLFKKGLIDKNTRENGKRGRPPVFWNVKNASKNVSFN